MFSYRFVLLNKFITEKLISSCKSTINGKHNVLKSFNYENKSLFGNLIGQQKLRKKKVLVDKVVCSSDILETNVSENEKLAACVKSKNTSERVIKRSKSVQNKVMTPVSTMCEVPPPEDIIDISSIVLSNDTKVNRISQEPKKRVRKLEPVKESTKQDSKEVAVEQSDQEKLPGTPLLSEDFVLKPSVHLNEFNYPIDNPNKKCLYSQRDQVGNVLSYSFTDPLIKEYIKYPSVSKIMEETMPSKNKLILSKWRQNMIDELGEEQFIKHCEDLKARGKEFHLAVRNTVLCQPTESCSEVTCNALKSLEWMLQFVTSPMAVESIIAHPQLEYKGIPDCVAMFRNVPVVIDWKLSDKPKKDLKDTYEAPVQITAYIGALNHDPNYKWGVNHGLVAVAYTSGDPCDVFLLAPNHCQIYWRHWLQRCDRFKARSHLHLDHVIDEKALGF